MVIITRGSFSNDEGLPNTTTKNALNAQNCEPYVRIDRETVDPLQLRHIRNGSNQDIPGCGVRIQEQYTGITASGREPEVSAGQTGSNMSPRPEALPNVPGNRVGEGKSPILDGDQVTKNEPLEEFCEANVLISLIDGVSTRERCEYRWRHIYITSEKKIKLLCDFHHAFMDFAIAITQDEQEGGAA